MNLQYIPNKGKQNYTFCRLMAEKRLDTHLNESTNQNLIKVPYVLKTTNKKTLL